MLPRFLPSRCFGYVGQLVVFPSDSQWRSGVEISANNIELATTTNLDGAGNSSHSVPSSSRRPLDDEIYFFCRTFLRREPSHLEQSTFFFDLLQFCGLPSAGIWLGINKWVLMALAGENRVINGTLFFLTVLLRYRKCVHSIWRI